ncbi:zinc ribbon domain-containing protein [Mollicutes bacterium LVI A0039]|nr:zinc ribbon domain-containing protein [Mollicutes bacterium LVI A0039]
MNTDKLCQSCAMPLFDKNDDLRGTEKNQTKSEKYCFRCYRNGKYIEPMIAFEDMVSRGITAMENSNANRFKKFLMRKSYPTLLRQLDRWK